MMEGIYIDALEDSTITKRSRVKVCTVYAGYTVLLLLLGKLELSVCFLSI